jgi:hypothetical protein
MAVRVGVIRAERRSAQAIAAHSRTGLDRALRCPAELWVAVASDEARLLGAFQRAAGLPESPPLLRRGSGGPAVLLGPGTIHVALALAHPAVLADCDPKRIVNRCVRPLLRALSRSLPRGSLAHFFGRDWISVAHHPAGWVGFGHDATTQRTLFEAFVAVSAPFAEEARASFRGKTPGTLESICGSSVDPLRVADAIVDAYAGQEPSARLEEPETSPDPEDLRRDPAWTATRDEIIGSLGAGPDAGGVFRVGGDLLVSRDALARLEDRGARAQLDELGRVVDETVAVPGVALDGVQSLTSLRDVIAEARQRS